MDKKVTIYDIAKTLEITAATVSRALNNNPKISAKTRELVLETAKKMNYKQNRLAQALKSGKSNIVGVIIPKINRTFFATIIKAIEDELYPHGYHVIICQTDDRIEREIDNIDTLLKAQVDGILISISNAMEDASELQRVIDKKVPLIFFDRKKELKGISSVTIDDFKGGYIATEHLINSGCKQIVHITCDRSLDIYKDRCEGYKKALSDYKIPFRKEYVIEVKNTIDAGKEAVKKLKKSDTFPDAIFSASDYVALGVIQELKHKGYKIPEEVSVVGFSNEPFTSLMELSITSVDQSPKKMGKIAAQVFLEQVSSSSELKIEKKIVLTPKLHIRKSSLKMK